MSKEREALFWIGGFIEGKSSLSLAEIEDIDTWVIKALRENPSDDRKIDTSSMEYHIGGYKFTTSEKGHLTWTGMDSKGNPIFEETPGEITVKTIDQTIVACLEDEVDELQERVANLERHNKWLLEAKEDNTSITVTDNIVMAGRIADLEEQNDKLRGDNANLIHNLEASETMNDVLSEKNANLANLVCEYIERIAELEEA